MYDIGKIQLAMLRKAWPKSMLAKRAGVSVATVQRAFEVGSAHPHTVQKMCRALKLNIKDLVLDPSEKRKAS